MTEGLHFTHGVAAKLINVYFKAGFVCGGHHLHERVRAIHPPIDSLLLDELYSQNVGGKKTIWSEAKRIRFSKFNSTQYETVITAIRDAMQEAALWEVDTAQKQNRLRAQTPHFWRPLAKTSPHLYPINLRNSFGDFLQVIPPPSQRPLPSVMLLRLPKDRIQKIRIPQYPLITLDMVLPPQP